MTVEEIQAIAEDLSERLKKGKPLNDMEAVELAEAIAVHSKGVKPHKLIKEKAPNEDTVEFKYRMQAYEPRTMPYWDNAENKVNRIWSEQNHSIKFDDPEQEKYFTSEYPEYRNLVQGFVKPIVTPYTLSDPNAVACLKPIDLPFKEDPDGVLVPDQSELLEPVVVIYGISKVVEFNHRYFLALTAENSMVTYGNINKKEGLVFELYDENVIWKIYQVGAKKDYKFEFYEWYSHGWDKIPAWRLKGNPIYREGKLLYHSYFQPAIPNLNTATVNGSTLDAVIMKHAFPTRAYYVERCDVPACRDTKMCDLGYVWDYTEEKKMPCDVCHGTGQLTKFTWGSDYQHEMPDRLNEGAPQPPFPGLAYVQPDPTIMEFLEKKIEKDILSAFAFLNIDVSDSKVKGSETALGKQIDREELFAFLLSIATDQFELLKNIIEGIGFMRYGTSFKMPDIKIPNEFTLKSSAHLTEEYADAIEKGLPYPALKSLTLEYMNQRFSNDELKAKLVKTAIEVDRYFFWSSEDIRLGVNVTIPNWAVILHDSIFHYLNEKIEDDPNYLDKDIKDIKIELEEMAKAEVVNPARSADGILDRIEL